ncbi:hypothetical protein LPTSP4_07020 [Leptospira ryugenii]|uniref:Ig-like domain-containing protein n=1 Tax=Leptospira ryugenii TaxID=1917863 RepID=A0A2P2DX56_9LEPT|nr:hypothetical protein [Leptospira ryugenii]GBF49192.1 hypothetical protein LPTSP4_07020 [Leptospira ryugenii]
MTLFLEDQNPLIAFYEIEFLRSEDAKSSPLFPIQTLKPGRSIVKADALAKYFRVRAVSKLNVRGHWSKIQEIKRYPASNANLSQREYAKPAEPKDLFVKTQRPNQLEPDLYLSKPEISFFSPKAESQKVKFYYRYADVNWRLLTETSLQFTEEGEYNLEYYAMDELGNRDTIQKYHFYVDLKPPRTSLKFLLEGKDFSNGQNQAFMHPNTNIQLSADDSGSGVQQISYRIVCRIDEKKDWLVYTIPIPVSEIQSLACPSDSFIQFRSIDFVGNQELDQSIRFQFNQK